MSVAALIPAAGEGRRLGEGPKAFVRIGGRTLIEHAFALFAPLVDEWVVAVPEGRLEEAERLLAAHAETGPTVQIVAGGADRQGTVERLLAATSSRWVLVHDAARPLTPPDVVARVLQAARTTGAATASIAVADTLHDTAADRTLPRDALRAVQTPQGFDRRLLIEAHRAAREAGRAATDDASLVRALGRPVAWVEGSPWSHKLTHPEDRDWLEALARGRDARVAGTGGPS